MSDVRILIADDHELIRKGLRTALDGHEGWTVCGEAKNGREAVQMANATRPDIVIMDLTMPELNGLDATRRICRDLPNTHVLILTMHDSEQLIHEVLSAGAKGYILKSDAGSNIPTAIGRLLEGNTFFTSAAEELLLKAPGAVRPGRDDMSPETLTPREREIIQLIAEGNSNKEVASALGISVKTADTHRTNLMRKLAIHSVSEIVRYAIRNKMIQA